MIRRLLVIAMTFCVLTPRVFSAGCAHEHGHGQSHSGRPHWHLNEPVHGTDSHDHDDDAIYFSDDDAAPPNVAVRLLPAGSNAEPSLILTALSALSCEFKFRRLAWWHAPPGTTGPAPPLYLQYRAILL